MVLRLATPKRTERGVGRDRVPESCRSCELGPDSLWAGLCAHDQDELHDLKGTAHYEAGQALFLEGNPCTGVHCITAGVVALRKSDAAGHSAIVRLAARGDALGHRALFDGGRHSVSAYALTAVSACFVAGHHVQRMAERNPSLALNVARRLGDELKRSEENQLRMATRNVRQRAAQLIADLRHSCGRVLEDGSIEIELPLARRDMAEAVGTRPETIARALKHLEDRGVARLDGRRIIVPDLDLLYDEIERDGVE